MDSLEPFPSGFPLHELPNLTDEVFFAFHVAINKIIYLNAAFERVWNVSRETVNSDLSLLFNSIHPDDQSLVANSFAALLKDGKHQKLEFRIILPAPANQKWIKLNAYTSQKYNREIITGIATDITNERDYSDTLHKFADKKNSILHILSHDLLGPLGNIEISAELLSENAEYNTNGKVLRLIDAIKNSSKKSVDMIRDLINEEFLQSSEASLVKQRIDIAAKMSEIINQYQQTPRSVPQRFTLETSSESLFVSIDESKFMQVIINLLSNALKFTPDDGNIKINIEEKGKNVLIKVQDNGIGIPANLQPFLFDKFTKARRPGLNGEPTTGLGMSIIKTIIGWHNGRIWFESTEGKGTTFYLEIPKEN